MAIELIATFGLAFGLVFSSIVMALYFMKQAESD